LCELLDVAAENHVVMVNKSTVDVPNFVLLVTASYSRGDITKDITSTSGDDNTSTGCPIVSDRSQTTNSLKTFLQL
jgi:hypothetical protein